MAFKSNGRIQLSGSGFRIPDPGIWDPDPADPMTSLINRVLILQYGCWCNVMFWSYDCIQKLKRNTPLLRRRVHPRCCDTDPNHPVLFWPPIKCKDFQVYLFYLCTYASIVSLSKIRFFMDPDSGSGSGSILRSGFRIQIRIQVIYTVQFNSNLLSHHM